MCFSFGIFAQDYNCSGYYHFLNEGKIRAVENAANRGTDLSTNYNLIYSRFYWNINPDSNYIIGKVSHYFRPLIKGLDVLAFELAPELIVDTVLYHGTRLVPIRNAYQLNIQLPDTVSSSIDSVTIVYHGKPPSDNGAFQQDFHGTEPIISTLSEPYGARDWWPCKQSLNDKIDSIDVFVQTPNKCKAASNGALVSVASNMDGKLFHWKHRYPIAAYLVAVAVTNYADYTDYASYKGDSVMILNYIYPEDSAYTRPAINRTAAIMEVYMNKFGKYPFFKEKYGHAQFARNGGMEHQTMGFMGFFNDMLIGHEMAHQWFGDMVTCGSWSDIWLNESFATFAEAITFEYLYPKQNLVDWRKSLIKNICNESGGSVYIFGDDTNNVNRVFDHRLSYQKGGIVLQMLRLVVGDSAFFSGIQNYLSDPKIAYGYAKTDDFRKHIEATSGKDLKKFFNDWIYLEGYPTYTLRWKQTADNLLFNVSQTTSNSSVTLFELPIPILLKGKGRDSMIVLNNNENNQKINFKVDFIVDTIYFDPDNLLISRNSKLINETIRNKQLISVYPMPFDHSFKIVISNEAVKIEKIQICDLTGRLVDERDYGAKVFNPGSSIDIATSIIHPAVYILRIITSDKIIIYPIIKTSAE